MSSDTDYFAIARVQSAKLQLTLERIDNLKDALRNALLDVPEEKLHAHVPRARLLNEPMNFKDVPHAGLHLTLTKRGGELVAVTWQDDEGRVIHRIWEKPEMTSGDFAELYRLREEVKGPEGFKTWREAALHERMRRVEVEMKLAAREEATRL